MPLLGKPGKKAGPGDDEPLTPTAALAGIGVCAVLADGRVAPEEQRLLEASLHRMRLFQNPNAVGLGINQAVRIAQRHGDAELLKRSAAGVPEDLKATAFALATDLVLVDGEVTDAEEASIERIQEALGVPDGLAHKIVEVMLIRNRG
jgi:uncharacterized tellurite resistance protein B-like protein